MKKKHILYIAPLPPPISGHSLISKVIFDYLSRKHQVKCINLIHNSNGKGEFSLKRFLSIFIIFKEILKFSKDTSYIYFTISESLLGNIKDIIIYLLLFKKINKFILHLHGGSIDKEIFQKFWIIRCINSFFYKRVSRIIITGNSHKSIFSMVNQKNIFIAHNFVENYLFIDNLPSHKFKNLKIVKVLYLSNMDQKKGYLDLLICIEEITKSFPNSFEFNFAGSFSNKKEEEFFVERIKAYPCINYHGFVEGLRKKKLLHDSHIFCLPTRYLEGQPVSILEAYASGCTVLTTGKPGILDIFKNNINGYLIKEKSPMSIKRNLIKLIKNKSALTKFSTYNFNLANNNFKQKKYCEKIESLFE